MVMVLETVVMTGVGMMVVVIELIVLMEETLVAVVVSVGVRALVVVVLEV